MSGGAFEIRVIGRQYMKTFGMVIMVAGMVFLPQISHTQTASIGGFNTGTVMQPAQPDSVLQIAADSLELQQVAPADLPFSATYYWAMPDGGIWPMPFLPQDAGAIYQITDNQFIVDNSGGELAVPVRPRRFGMQAQSTSAIASALAAQADSLVSFINQIQDAQFNREFAAAFGLDEPMDSSGGSSFMAPLYDTNQLYLLITTVSNGWAYLNLYNASNQVYAIYATTNILTPLADWQVVTELWPTLDQTKVLPFTVATQDQPIQFFRAEDWTGVYANGLPCWWTWQYFGDLSHAGSDQDVNGNTLLYDYQHGIDPTIPIYNPTGSLTFTNGLQMFIFEPKPATDIP